VVIAAAAFGVIVALYFGLAWVVVSQALVAEAKPLVLHPSEFGLAFDEVAFPPRGSDEITLRGWWFPNPDAKAVIIRVHGLDSTRAVDLELDRDLLAAGFAMLSFDLRGHGESDAAPMGAGLREQDDVRGAIDFVLSDRGAEPGKVLLLGRSFGAAVVLLTGLDEPAVAGVYADSAFASLADVMVKEVGDRTPIPGFGATLLKPGLILMARWAKGIDIRLVEPEKVVGEYPYNIGLAHCQGDERIPFDQALRIWSQANAPLFTAYPDCEHAAGYEDFGEQYVEAVVGYFEMRIGE
jgi:pimeloyl-ACP methyl ester carboxylesterase